MEQVCAAAVLLLTLVSTCNSTKFEIYGFLDHSVSLPALRPINTAEIVCKLDGNKVFEWETEKNTQYFGSYKGRTELKEKSVLLKELQKNDTGEYLLEFILQDGHITKTVISLIVLEPLAMPEINCTGNASIVFLSCYLNGLGSHVTSEWEYQNAAVMSNDNFALSDENKHLTILNPQKFPEEFICIMNQPENSSQSNPVRVQDCIENKGNGRAHNAIVVVVVVVVFIILGVIGYLTCYRQKQRKASIKEFTSEPLNIEASQAAIESKDQDACEPLNPEASQDEPAKINKGGADIDCPNDTEQTAPRAPIIE
ncbi:uncharacterized protein [Heterodontus francisci]|uniref:uncharacterized protein n=1 Tax=Heterodontus francisci TaxID=7792 RepID=UPI00355AD801